MQNQTKYLFILISQITDNTGKLLAEQSFDAWGRYRDPETWQYESEGAAKSRTLTASLLNGRGYTGHEMLPTFALINMNGRLYDPQLGRMLSPDNYIQLPDYTQNFNRYSYVLNNPLKYRDPNGEFINLIIGAIVGAYMGYIAGDMAGATGWKLVGYIGVGALAGALTSGMAAGVGSALGGGSFAAGFVGSAAAEIAPTGFIAGATIGATSGFVGGFVTGVGTGLLEGQTLGQSLKQGAIYGGIGAVSGGLIGGVSEGIHAKMLNSERSFWTGSYKTYEGSEALYSSLDDGCAVYTDIDDYTVFNGSDKNVYYSPEDNSVPGLRDVIKPGKGIKADVDGIATKMHSDQVFKIPGKSIFRPNANVQTNGDVILHFDLSDKAALQYKQFVNPNYRYGWLYQNDLPRTANWMSLFRLAKLISIQ